MNMRKGSWWLTSETEPQWNCTGETSFCGGFGMPKECAVKLGELIVELGEPPEDLEFGYMKD
jgi:hypothetical protein